MTLDTIVDTVANTTQDVIDTVTEESTNTSTTFTFGDDDSGPTLTCSSSSSTVFSAPLEMVLEGRNDFLGRLERTALQRIFLVAYNHLLWMGSSGTTRNETCDLYDRRLTQMELLEMSNPLGDLVNVALLLGDEGDGVWEDLLGGDGPFRPPPIRDNNNNNNNNMENDDKPQTTVVAEGILTRQSSTNTAQACVNKTTSACDDTGSVTMLYNVTGTCRACPVSEAGSFALFDDQFRRSLQLVLRRLQQPPPIDDTSCVCTATGQPPTRTQAPRIPELLEDMNQDLDKLRIQQGLFQNISRIQRLRQLDSFPASPTTVSRTSNNGRQSRPALKSSEVSKEHSSSETAEMTVPAAPTSSGLSRITSVRHRVTMVSSLAVVIAWM